jgi:hypothetical protein
MAGIASHCTVPHTRPQAHRLRAALSALLALGLGLGSLFVVPPVASAAGETDGDRLAAAAQLLSRQVRQFDEPIQGKVQWTYDVLLGLAAAGDGTSPAMPGQAWNLLDSLKKRAALDPSTPSNAQLVLSGTPTPAVTGFDEITQVLHIAGLYGQNAADFAGRDFAQALAGYQFNGTDTSWYRTTTTGSARVSALQQARAVLALTAARQGSAASAAAASLAAKQITTAGANLGGWSTSYTGTSFSLEPTVNAVIALTAEGSAASLSAAQLGATNLIGRQSADGTFTGATTVVLVAQTVNALKGIAARSADSSFQATANASIAKAQAWLRSMQVVNESGADALYNGAFLTSAADRGQIRGGTFDRVRFGYINYPNKGLVESTFKGILGLGLPLATLGLTDPAGDRPTVEGPYFESTDGVCEGTGTTVIVDYGSSTETGVEHVATRCVTGTQASAWAALRNAGFVPGSDATTVTSTAGPGNKICEIDGVRASCGKDGSGTWSLWSADSDSKTWKAASANPSSWAPKPGTVLGLRLAATSTAPSIDPPVADDGAPPVVVFTAGPQGGVTGATSRTFTWKLDNSGPATSYRLDDGEWTAYTGTTTSQSFTWDDIGYGEHTFSVRATDIWGNFSTVKRTFTLAKDTTAPVVAILRKPGKRTSASTATFTMSVDDSTAAVKCRLDGTEAEDWQYCSAPLENGSPATSRTYTKLEPGTHTFEYRATDRFGNSSSASYVWEIAVDAPPVVQITSTQNAHSNNNSSVSVSYLVATATTGWTVQSTQCRLDGGDWAACGSTVPAANASATASFTPDSPLADGPHTVDIRATAAAENGPQTSEVATYNWTVDTAAPLLTLTGPDSGAKNSGTVAWTATDTSPVTSVKCALDGISSTCSSSPFQFSGLGVGHHEVTVTATDAANNTSPEATVGWDVGRAGGVQLGTLAARDVTPSSLTTTSTVTGGDLDVFVEAELWQNGQVVKTQTQALGAGEARQLTYSFAGLTSSTSYQVRLVATDENAVGTASAPLTIDTAPAPATVSVPTVDTVTSVTAEALAVVHAGDLGVQVTAEVLKAGAVAATSAAQSVAAGDSRTLAFSFTGLTGSTAYQVRVRAVSTDGTQTSATSAVWTTSAYPPSFAVKTSARSVLAGNPFTVTATGLRATEGYQVLLSGKVVGTGKATSAGTVSRKLTVSSTAAQENAAIRLVGASADRYGLSSIWVASKKAKLKVGLTATVNKDATQQITVSGLVPGETLTIKVTGRSTKSAKANPSGTYSYSFKVGKKKGTKKVTVYGQVTTRTGKSSYKVK